MKLLKDNLVFLPLGGAGEIGMNCNLYHYNDSWIMIDLGVTFSDLSMTPYDIIMPDLNFILEKKVQLSGLILTHAHEDHIGAVPYLYKYLNNIPIYTTPFTASVLKRKFESVGCTNYKIILLEYNKRFKIGAFDIEAFALTHSIPEPNSIIIRSKKGNVFHTGDWKIDPQPLVGQPINHKKLEELSNEGIHTLVCDSTNVFDETPSGSEEEVRVNLREIFKKKKKGKFVITCFASNIARLETILTVSNESGKYCVLLGRSLHRIYESAIENNYLEGLNNIVDEKDAKSLLADDLVIICTGSQGENRAALSRLINNKHNFFNLEKDDTVIFSSREIPGNEKKIGELKKNIIKKGSFFLDHNNSKIHVSGHPSKEELKKMYKWIKPKLLIPVHGEYRHLSEHIDFAKSNGINQQLLVENGDLVLLDNDSKPRVLSKVYSGKNVLKGNQILKIDDKIFSNLRVVNSDGEIFVNIIMNLEDSVLSDPVIFCPTIFEDEKSKIELQKLISDEIKKLSKSSIDDRVLSEEIKKIIRSFIKKKNGLKPSTYVEIVRI